MSKRIPAIIFSVTVGFYKGVIMNTSWLFELPELILAILGAACSYMSLLMIVGLFSVRHFPEAKYNHRYAILIAARNEANVIGQLLQSLHEQTYPQELMTVFVVADNCSDHTAQIAREHGAICYERFDSRHQTKGFALQYLFRELDRDYGIHSFDGYLIFDADNILRSDYMEKMNRAFDSGEKIVTSYRNTKNWENSCIAASYAIHWLRTARCENRGKSVLRLACRVQGTGFLFSNELVTDGWNYTDLTEDRSFCADAVRKGYRISYQHEAEFFDDQPEDLSIAFRQRIRWSKGHLQAFQRLGKDLFKRCFTTRFHDAATAYDMLMINFPMSLIQSLIKVLEFVICVCLVCLLGNSPAVFSTWVKGALLAFAGDYFGNLAMAAYTMFMERKHIPHLPWHRILWYCLTFPMFSLIGTITTCIAAVSKVEWKPIPHRAADLHTLKKIKKSMTQP